MNEVLLLKCGELVLKGLNRRSFEEMLIKNIKSSIQGLCKADIFRAQSTIYLRPLDSCDMDELMARMRRVFGLSSVSRCFECEKNYDSILSCLPLISNELREVKSFKVESKRSDKAFPMTSPELSAALGGAILELFPHLHVDVKNPEITVHCDVRDFNAYISAGKYRGAGGLPVGTCGKGLLLLSGGIDSPVAGYMLARRGVALSCVHFFSYPYTSPEAKEKVLSLGNILERYAGVMRVYMVPFTKVQEQIRMKCPEDYFTIIMRRFMMRIAEKICLDNRLKCIITGESLGQVASQTMEALGVTNAVCTLPVFRPLIGMDKDQIVEISRFIEAFETSILPYEDCCTVFTPKHPKTKPRLHETEDFEKALDIDALVSECVENVEILTTSGGK